MLQPQLPGHCVQTQLRHQGVDLRLQPRPFGGTGIVLSVQQIERGAVPHLTAQLGRCQAGLAGGSGRIQRGQAGLTTVHGQPSGACHLADLLTTARQFGEGFVMQVHGLLQLGAAHAAGIKRHIQHHAQHLLALRVAGHTKITRAAEPIARGLRHQVKRGRGGCTVFVNFILRSCGLGLLQLEHGVVLLGPLQPDGDRLCSHGHTRATGRLQRQHLNWQAGHIGQHLTGHAQIVASRNGLSPQSLRACLGFVGVRYRGIPQSKSVFGFGQGFVDRLLLLQHQRQPAFGLHHVKVALRGQQHPVLLRQLPFVLAGLRCRAELGALGAALRVVQRLFGIECPAGGIATMD